MASVPSRALDSVYDPVYTISHGGGQYHNKHARRTSVATQEAAASVVSGTNRAKYFKRPVLPYLQAVAPEILLAPSGSNVQSEGLCVANSSKKLTNNSISEVEFLQANDSSVRSIGIQTIYRDSDAQTMPYTPNYTIAPNKPTPEILSLSGMKCGSDAKGMSLPVGLEEIELIERNRQRVLFDSTLPPMTDEASFELRKEMMEAQEIMEWNFREDEINKVQNQRLQMLQDALVERDLENEFLSEQRIEVLRQKKAKEKNLQVEKIQQLRVKNLRKLQNRRKDSISRNQCIYDGASSTKRDVIKEYDDGASIVYAPKTRDGRVCVKKLNKPCQLEMSFNELNDLERTMPRSVLDVVTKKPGRPSLKNAKGRKEAITRAHLENMANLIAKNKLKEDPDKIEVGPSGTPRRISTDTIKRPPTPILHNIEECEKDKRSVEAINFLQRLLRGRAVQNMMYEGKEKRCELIDELRSCDESNKSLLKDTIRKQEETDMDCLRDTATGEVISELLDFLYKEKVRDEEFSKIKEYQLNAVQLRKKREIEEGGRRHAEEILRAREDLVYQQIQIVHQETVDDFISDSIFEIVNQESEKDAMYEIGVYNSSLSPLIVSVEDSGNSDKLIVKDLVASFLLPEVQRGTIQKQVIQEEKKYVSATHQVLLNTIKHMKH